jgi:hypothetical protein
VKNVAHFRLFSTESSIILVDTAIRLPPTNIALVDIFRANCRMENLHSAMVRFVFVMKCIENNSPPERRFSLFNSRNISLEG